MGEIAEKTDKSKVAGKAGSLNQQQETAALVEQSPAFSGIEGPQKELKETSEQSPGVQQLKAVQDMAMSSPQSDKMQAIQSMASKSAPLQNPVTSESTGETVEELPTMEKEAAVKPAAKEGEISNNYNKAGFITEKASLRKTEVVNSIIASHKADKKKAASVIKSGVLAKDKGWFGMGLLGVKSEKFELSDNFDPKKLGYLIPVKIDQKNEDLEIGWTPVQINYNFDDTAKQKLSIYKDTEGYVDTKKLVKSELNLNAKGTALTGKENQLGATMNGSLVGKVAGFAINNSKTVRDIANDAVGGALDMFNKGADFIQKNALNKVEILKGLSFGLEKDASRITPQGSFITGKVKKDEWVFSSTFKVNTQGDYSAEYMGSVIENPPELHIAGQDAAFTLNFGSMVKHQANAEDPAIISEGGEASFQLMGQEVFAKWNELDFNLRDKKVSSADFSEVGITLNLSVGDIIKVENLTAAIHDLTIAENVLNHGDVSLSIASVNLFDVATFRNIRGSIGQKTGFSGEGAFEVIAPDLAAGQGTVSVSKGPEDAEPLYKLEDGAFNASILSQEVSFTGVHYDSTNPGQIGASSGNLKMNFSVGDIIQVDEFNASVANAKLSREEGFTYDEIGVQIATVQLFNQIASFNNISGRVRPDEGFEAEGEFAVTAPGLADASGKVSVKKGSEEPTTQYKLDGGSFKATVLGQELNLTGVTYDSANPQEINIASSNLKLDFSAGTVLRVDAVDATLSNARISNEGFSYDDISVSIAGINVLDIAQFTDISGNLSASGAFNATGNFELTLPGLGDGKGNVAVEKGPEDKMIVYRLEEGSFTAEILGQKAGVTGVQYDSSTNIFTIGEGQLDLDIFGVNLKILIQNPAISKEKGFDFDRASATIPELVFADEAKLANIEVNVVKDGDQYNYDGSSDFDLKGTIGGASASGAGKVSISKDGGDGTKLTFENANASLTIFGQSLELVGVNYDSGVFSAEKTTAKLTTGPSLLNKNLEISINDLNINSEGYTFSKSELDTQLSVDFGFIQGNLTKLGLEKSESSWTVSGEGGLSAGGTQFFGQDIPRIEGTGSLSYDFGKKETKKELNKVSATLPTLEFPGSLFPGKIGGSAEIPVLPGLNVVAAAGMQGQVLVPGLQLSLAKKEDQVYVISAGTQEGQPATGTVTVFVSVGVGTGIPFLASVSVSLGAEGGITVALDFNMSKDISFAKDKEPVDLNEASTQSEYHLAGDISLAAFLELKATAFYFFSKSFRKDLAKRSLGGFEKSNTSDFTWIKPGSPLQTESDIKSYVKDDMKLNLDFVENKIWTKAQFVEASSGIFKGERKRILAVDRALGEFDAVRGESIHSDVKIRALNKLSRLISTYLKETAGTSSRTPQVEKLNRQIEAALKILHQKVAPELIVS
jgi:hypothetical protein